MLTNIDLEKMNHLMETNKDWYAPRQEDNKK